jgi:hypothetical protein
VNTNNSKEEVNNWVEKVKSASGTIFLEPKDYKKGYALTLLIRMVTNSIS